MAPEHEPPLGEDEIARLRLILQQDARLAWFWSTTRKWAAWAFGVAALLAAFKTDIRELLGWVGK